MKTVVALILAMFTTVAFARQQVPDRQIDVFTNDYAGTLKIIEGPTLANAFSNLEPNVCLLISNKLDALTNVYYLVSNPSNFISEAEATNLISNAADTNDYYLNSNPSNFITAADVPGFAGVASPIHGFEVKYSSATTVDITPGRAIVCGETIQSSSVSNHSVSVPASPDLVYFYLSCSDAQSTNVSIIDSTGEPSYNAQLGAWTDSNTNRLIGVIWVTNNVIVPFEQSDGWYSFGPHVLIETNNEVVTNDGTGQWEVPGVNLTSVVTPVNADMILLNGVSDDNAGTLASIALTTEELAQTDGGPNFPVLEFSQPRTALLAGHGDAEEADTEGWMLLGESRDIRYWVEAFGGGAQGIDDSWHVHMNGWRFQR